MPLLEKLPARCEFCGKPFGLIRHHSLRFMQGSVQFCTVLCKEHYWEKKKPQYELPLPDNPAKRYDVC